jgi:diphthamide biosynthesis protein 4
MLYTSVNHCLTRIGPSAEQLKQGAVINGDVDLDEMDYDEITGTFSLPCRCSGSYSIREQDMENGMDIASCDNCSLIIRVLYDVVEDDE